MSWSRTATSPPTISAPSPLPTRSSCGARRTRASSRAPASPRKPPPCSPPRKPPPSPPPSKLTGQQRRGPAALLAARLSLLVPFAVLRQQRVHDFRAVAETCRFEARQSRAEIDQPAPRGEIKHAQGSCHGETLLPRDDGPG